MKKNILLYMAAVAGMILAGCSKDSIVPENEASQIRISAGIGNLTKINYNGTASSFAKDDQISVYAWVDSDNAVPSKKVVDGVVNTYDGEVWNPEVQMLWKTVVDPHYFIGVFPVRTITNFEADPYEQVALDYTASDLLIATNMEGVKASSNPVALNFDHAMAKLQINLKFRSQWNEKWETLPEKENITVTLKAKTVGTVNYLSKTITASSTAEAEALILPVLANAPESYTYSYSNLVIPQGNVTEVVVTVGENDFVYTYPEENGMTLERGKVTTLGLIVGREELELASVSINDWTTDTTVYTEGEADIDDVD